ncbi:helix-turn-helix domain-containing protein [Nocardia lijiangensis]|uniref:helix-turn-helix domain-containing protein n=1 Tax=Nocardia lijiangensis TaxID=299618 RepID=UPI003D73BA42
MSEMTTAQAAEILQVTQRQVARLTASGQLVATRRIGRAWLLDAASVHRLAQQPRRQGQPWSARIAWAALAALSGTDPRWITSSERTRMMHRLRRTDIDDLLYLASRRARILRFRAHRSALDELSTWVVPTGAFALDDARRRTFGLTTAETDLDGYIGSDTVDSAIDQFGLIEDPAGTVTLRVVTEEHAFTGGTTPQAAVALDLAESLNSRERSAGRGQLASHMKGIRHVGHRPM